MSPELAMVSLYSGAGGLDLGLEAAGFRVVLAVEPDSDARATITTNFPDWTLTPTGRIEDLDHGDVCVHAGVKPGELALLAGGPPCQPFSKSGYWFNGDSARLDDPRAHTLGAYFDVLQTMLPRAFILENVPGIAYRAKSEGLDLVERRLAEINARESTNYSAHVLHLNAADYGVPQLRRRVVIVGSREGAHFGVPSATHSSDAEGGLQQYITAWDAIGDLDVDDFPSELLPTGKWAGLLPSIPEGCNYLWHTAEGGGASLFGSRTRYWSFLLKLAKSQPSWTLQAAPGPATGPFHWRNRMLSVREYCRLQTFPDAFEVSGSRRAAIRQVGNAVPPLLAEVLGRAISSSFFGGDVEGDLRYSVTARGESPEPEPVGAVPQQYAEVAGPHPRHPGTGKGPGAVARLDRIDGGDSGESAQ